MASGGSLHLMRWWGGPYPPTPLAKTGSAELGAGGFHRQPLPRLPGISGVPSPSPIC
jgi:hypothetical protein